MSRPDAGERLLDVYRRLERAYGDDVWHWMPEHVDGPLEVVAGAVLVQHTAWANAERALARLREAGALDPGTLLALPEHELTELVRPSGTPSLKARRLRAVAETIVDAGGLAALLSLPRAELRARLLATHGVGPETADAIALYAAAQPAFVIDAYTKRLFRRLGLGPEAADGYDAWQRWFEGALAGEEVPLYQRYHGYIVLHGKRRCRATPRCAGCPLLAICPEGVRRTAT